MNYATMLTVLQNLWEIIHICRWIRPDLIWWDGRYHDWYFIYIFINIFQAPLIRRFTHHVYYHWNFIFEMVKSIKATENKMILNTTIKTTIQLEWKMVPIKTANFLFSNDVDIRYYFDRIKHSISANIMFHIMYIHHCILTNLSTAQIFSKNIRIVVLV